MGSRSKTLVAMLGAIVYALPGFYIFLSWAVSLRTLVDIPDSGSAGLGAVSFGVGVLAVELVPILGSIVANRMLRQWALRSGVAAKRLHKAQMWSIVVTLVAMLATLPLFFTNTAAWPWLPLGGLALGASFLLTAALLGTYAGRTLRNES